MTRRRPLVLVAALTLVVIAACDGDGARPLGTQPPPPPSTTGGSTTTETTTGTTVATSVESTTTGTAGETASGLGPLECWAAPIAPATSGSSITLADVTGDLGLIAPLLGMHGHAAAWGDVDGNGRPDLVVGSFADRPEDAYRLRGADGPQPDQVLVSDDTFTIAEGWTGEFARTSGAVFADFDGDGDSDLLLIRHPSDSLPTASQMFENRGGTLVAVSNPLPDGFRGRTPVVADFDGDGLLDLYVSQDRYGDRGGLLLRNDGSFEFSDLTAGSGLEGVKALSAAAADLDGDGRADLVTSERIFIATGDFTFSDRTPTGFGWTQLGPDDDPAGVAIGDVDNDGLPDIVVGHHYRSIVEEDQTVAIRLFRQERRADFREITEDAGLVPLPSLAPHVELADMDNDGWLDIVTSASADGGERPAIFRNVGGSPPVFEVPSGMGSLQYWVGTPVVDFDRDGRLDVFALEWEPALPSRLFRNETEGGHWLEVSIGGPAAGIGTVVEVLDENGTILGRREIGVSGGYASGGLPYAHFGLGNRATVNVRLHPPGSDPVTLDDVDADRHIRWPEGC